MPPKTTPGGDDLQKQFDEATAKIETLTKQLDTATKVAALPSAHRDHYGGLGTDEEKAAFLAKSESDRSAIIEELTKQDKLLYKALDGTEYRASDGEKSASLAKQADDLAKRLAQSEAERSSAVLEKRADSELGSCPGDVKVRAAVLKAVDGITDETLRQGAQELLKAGNAALSKKMVRGGTRNAGLGVDDDVQKAAEVELEQKARDLAKEKSIDFYDAYDQVSILEPDLAKRALGSAAPVGG
jgi:hypothetical protein